MSEDRDTRVETLRDGDQIRYMGEWYDIQAVETPGEWTYVVTDVREGRERELGRLSGLILPYQRYKTLIFRTGTFVAAETMREHRPSLRHGLTVGEAMGDGATRRMLTAEGRSEPRAPVPRHPMDRQRKRKRGKARRR